ncbi:MAG: glycine cleavage system aminomethyltransferase GcvT [Gammaproteobacteria bacterium]|nr:glycine cleavage system aminomethyltransferase GcvT [Gammaproteobacteria bacterium]
MLNISSKVINKTSLWDEHAKLGAKFTDFAGVNMPIHYGSQISEHLAVRTKAGVFDVSHMAVIDITGPASTSFLRYILTNDVTEAKTGQAIYSCMCNEQGGIIDDLIVYNLGNNTYRLVVNAGTWEKDLDWLKSNQQNYNVDIAKLDNFSILALQGPEALNVLLKVIKNLSNLSNLFDLKPFECLFNSEIFIARTGYTGEDGFEIIISDNKVKDFWQKLIDNNVQPCGLGARDTLRLEAGLSLYGTDMDEVTMPINSGLGWTVALEDQSRDFVGKSAILEQKELQLNSRSKTRMIGLILEEKGVLRHGMKVVLENLDPGEGIITSGTYSPTLECSIAIARVNVQKSEDIKDIKDINCNVVIRDKLVPVKVVSYPFVRFNKAVYKILNKL